MAEKSQQELLQIDYSPPRRDWTDPSVDFGARRGTWSYAATKRDLDYMGFPNGRTWTPTDADWKLPGNWKEIIGGSEATSFAPFGEPKRMEQ